MGSTFDLEEISRSYTKSFSLFEKEFNLSISGKVKEGLNYGVVKWENKIHFCMNLYILNALSKINSLTSKDLT